LATLTTSNILNFTMDRLWTWTRTQKRRCCTIDCIHRFLRYIFLNGYL